MFTTADILTACDQLEIRLWVEDNGIRFDAPAGAIDAIKPALIEHKAELIELLTEPRQGPDASTPDPCDSLVGPRRTPWGTWVWSGHDAPAIEAFGPGPGA